MLMTLLRNGDLSDSFMWYRSVLRKQELNVLKKIEIVQIFKTDAHSGHNALLCL